MMRSATQLRRIGARNQYFVQQKRDIWPLVAGGIALFVVGTVGKYVVRALNRVQEENSGSDPHDESPRDTELTEEQKKIYTKYLGVDIGSAFAKVSFGEDGKCDIIENKEGARATPSILLNSPDDIAVGQLALKMKWMNPSNVAFGYHVLNGLNGSDPTAAEYISKLRDGEKCDEQSGEMEVSMVAGGKSFSASLLRTILAQDLYLSVQSKNSGLHTLPAIISVPNYFSAAQTSAAIQSTRDGGFECVTALPDAVAALLGSQHGQNADVNSLSGKYVVVDVGGYITQISVVECASEGVKPEIISQRTLFSTGGEVVNDYLVSHIANTFHEKTGIQLLTDKMAKQRIYDAVESAKVNLSQSVSSTISVPYITADASGPKHLEVELSRSKLESIIGPHFESLAGPIKEVLREGGITESDQLAGCVLAGGGARMPLVQKLITECVGKSPSVVAEPEEVTVVGASLYSKYL